MKEPRTMTHKGNKSFLPSKPCVTCGRDMTWRKAWEKNWASVKYCSDPCRRRGSSATPSATSDTRIGKVKS